MKDSELVGALQRGGYVIAMRHASSPRELPDKQTADPQNVNLERQLDENGRETANAFGKALRELKIPVGAVLVSPTYRAMETARYAELPNPRAIPELGDNGRGMQLTTEAQADWLRKATAHFEKHKNTIIITHQPNIMDAFPQWSAALTDGEALVLGPDGKGGATLVARVKIQDWPRLVAGHGAPIL
jgi:phosphohistidine phosphatase SixA